MIKVRGKKNQKNPEESSEFMKEFHKFTREDELWSFFTSICHFQQSGFVPLSHNSTTSSTKENLLESKQSQVLRRAEAVRGRLISQKCLGMGTGQNRRPGVNVSCMELHVSCM